MRSIRHVATAVAALVLLAGLVPVAAGATPVDPGSLVPPPPPGASCVATAPDKVICHTAVSFPVEGEAIFEVGCGPVYQTSTDDRQGIRWYENGLLVKRVYRAVLAGTWSLSPDGSGPAIRITGHWNSSSTWLVPGDDATVVETIHGLHFHGAAPGIGGSLLLAGWIDDEGTHHGVNTVDEPLGEIRPESLAVIESVLCG